MVKKASKSPQCHSDRVEETWRMHFNFSRLPSTVQRSILDYSGFYGSLLLNKYTVAKDIRRSKPLFMELEIKYENSNELYLKCVIHFDGQWRFGIVKSKGQEEQIKWMFISNYQSLSNLLHQPFAAMFNEKNEAVMMTCWYSSKALDRTFSMGTYSFAPKRKEKCESVINTLLSSYIQIDEMKVVVKSDLPLLTINNMALAIMYFKEFVLVRKSNEDTFLCIYFNHDLQLLELMNSLFLRHRQKFHISSDFETNLWLVGYGKQAELASALTSLKETRFS